MQVMLDTNICIYIIKQKPAALCSGSAPSKSATSTFPL
jgi:predicted nucleic acid-binding protein